MPPPIRPARQSGSSSRPSVAPMSERQQMALLMQMTSTANEAELSPGGNTIRNRDRNERGETALHLAAKKGDHESVKKLLEQGVNPNMTDFAGWTPLHEAANHGHYNVAVVLAKAGANVNATGLDDITPLHDAAGVGQLKMVKMLIEKGADPLFKNKKGKTPADVAHLSLYNYFSHVVDMAKSQLKKSTDAKKTTNEEDETTGSGATTNSTFTNPTLSLNKEEVDVYEFKSTPMTSCSSGDEKSDGKNSDKSSDEKSGTDSDTPTASIALPAKRPFAELDIAEENDVSNTDEELKRKKRNCEISNKETTKNAASSRVVLRYEKGAKQPGPASKTLNLPVNKNTSLQTDRKSPCPSPKPLMKPVNESDIDAEDDSSGAASQKVPPLKIVIPQSGSSTEDSSSRANKSTSARNQSLPYVVSNNPDSSTEKEACPSPAESTKSGDDKIPLSKEDRTQQRVLRSAHKSGSSGQGSSAVDRGSNNSSPQNSSSPSPAATSGNESNQTVTQQANANSNSSSSSTTNQQLPSTSEPENTNVSSPAPSTTSTVTTATLTVSLQNSVELHPRKRKIKASKDQVPATTSATIVQTPVVVEEKPDATTDSEVHPHDQPFTNCYQMYINIRRQVERRQKNLQVVQPKPPQGFKDYLLNRRTYVLAGKRSNDHIVAIPVNLPTEMKDLFTTQEKERHKLKMQHIVEKEKLVLSVEQEILREHGRAARALANQSQPFSACTILREQEVYNVITPEQEEKDRNARSNRYNGRLFLSWLQDVDDKWEKIKEAMILRHHNEAESLHAVQKMDYEWKMKEMALCEYKAKPVIEELHVPIVHVSDDFDLLPA